MDKNYTPLVTVGVPVKDGDKTLSSALDTIVNQTYKNIEIIISDNVSKDNTSKIIKEYSEKYENIIHIKQNKQLNSITHYQNVFERANGKYFMFAADDDLRDKNYIETLVRGFDLFPNASIIFSDLVIFNDYLSYKSTPICDFDFQTQDLTFFKKIKLHFNGPFHIYGLIRTKYLLSYKWYDIDYGPDHPILFHLLSHGDFVYVPGTTFYFWKPKEEKSIYERAELYSLRKLSGFYKLKLVTTCLKTMLPSMDILDLLWKPFFLFFYLLYYIKGGLRGIIFWWR
tara:strand:- start:291 stop:1142 length:852 start_codon:yes stop_codon:yes gene_type:complete